LTGKGITGRVIAVSAVIIVVIILLLNPAVQGILRSIFIDPFQDSYPESVTFTLNRTLTLEANGGRVYNYTIDMSVPGAIWENDSPLQEVIEVSSQPASSTEERYGSEWMVWEGDGPVAMETRSVTITYRLKVSTFIWNLDSSQSGLIGDIPIELKEMYPGDEWVIVVDSPPIQERVDSIVGDQENALDALRSIYDWITENIDYATTTVIPQTSLVTLSSGHGDCDDQAVLFCALARAAGIPAWLQVGVLYDSHLQAWGGHGWVQTYIPTEGGGMNVTIDTVNGDFLVWRPNRFADFTDDGVASHLEDYYYSFHCSYDPASYLEGEVPLFDQEFEAIEYQESDERVRPGDFCIALVPAAQIARYRPGSGS